MGFTGIFSVETVLKIIAYGVKVSTQVKQLKLIIKEVNRSKKDKTAITNVLFLLITYFLCISMTVWDNF